MASRLQMLALCAVLVIAGVAGTLSLLFHNLRSLLCIHRLIGKVLSRDADDQIVVKDARMICMVVVTA